MLDVVWQGTAVQVLEFSADKIYDAGKEEGREEGRMEGREEGRM